MKTTCSCCGKPLEDPVSVDLGIGPVCRISKKLKELAEQSGNLFSNRAEYDYGIQGEVLWIEDLGGLKSVTNDIDNILNNIVSEERILLCKFKIIYCDSMGVWDGICFTSTGRVSFYSIGVKDIMAAKRKVLELS